MDEQRYPRLLETLGHIIRAGWEMAKTSSYALAGRWFGNEETPENDQDPLLCRPWPRPRWPVPTGRTGDGQRVSVIESHPRSPVLDVLATQGHRPGNADCPCVICTQGKTQAEIFARVNQKRAVLDIGPLNWVEAFGSEEPRPLPIFRPVIPSTEDARQIAPRM